MSEIRHSKSDLMDPTQSYKGGYLNLPVYTFDEIFAITPEAGTHPMVYNSTASKIMFWSGEFWEEVSSS